MQDRKSYVLLTRRQTNSGLLFSLPAATLALMLLLPHPEAARAENPAAESQRRSEAATVRPAQYVLGPDDQVSIWALGVEEIPDRPFRVDPQGYLELPVIGRIRAGGSTTDQLGADIRTKLAGILKQPRVSVSLVELRSQPISVVGAVGTPGVHQVNGRKTLLEALSLAGGLRPDSGYVVKITRRLEWGRIPLSSASDDSSGQFSVAEVALKGLMEAERPEENIAIQPFDVITVPRADLYYVVGEVHKSGGFTLRERKTIQVLEALSMAEGLTSTASPSRARILRAVKNSSERVEINVDLKRLLNGKQTEVALQADDILFVPSSTGKKIAARAIEAGIGVGSGVLIWRR